MFSFMKSSPKKQLEKKYKSLMDEAVQAQRSGKIERYAELIAASQKVLDEMDALDD